MNKKQQTIEILQDRQVKLVRFYMGMRRKQALSVKSQEFIGKECFLLDAMITAIKAMSLGEYHAFEYHGGIDAVLSGKNPVQPTKPSKVTVKKTKKNQPKARPMLAQGV